MLGRRIIEKLKDFFSTQPIEKVWIFGSYARGEERDDSDVDLLVKYTSGTRLGLFGICALKESIEDILGLHVDLVEEGTLYPMIEKTVNSEKVKIYER